MYFSSFSGEITILSCRIMGLVSGFDCQITRWCLIRVRVLCLLCMYVSFRECCLFMCFSVCILITDPSLY